MNNKEKKQIDVNIGIDVGIASVGWAVLNTDYKILLHGVRLFNTVDDAKDSSLLGVQRRQARQARRRIWRTFVRKREAIKLFIKEGLYKPSHFNLNSKEDLRKNDFVRDFQKFIEYTKEENESYKNGLFQTIYDIRLDALKNKISNDPNNKKLLRTLYWYLTHRGFSHTDLKEWDEKLDKKEANAKAKEEKEPKKEKSDSAKSEDKIKDLLKTLKSDFVHPIEKQKALMIDPRFLPENNGGIYKLRQTINNNFHRDEYGKELKQIMISQNLSDDFIKEYYKIFEHQRSYEHGPGSEKETIPSKYGLYQRVDNKTVKKQVNGEDINVLWDVTIGKCSVYPTEFRAPKYSLTSYLFNLVNDINNLRLDNSSEGEISTEIKKQIFAKTFVNGVLHEWTPNEIFKILKSNGIVESWVQIKGFKSKKKANNDVMKITEFEMTTNQKIKIINNAILEGFYYIKDLNLTIFDLQEGFDEIISILQRVSTKETLEKEFNQENSEVKNIKNFLKTNCTNKNKTFEKSYEDFVNFLLNKAGGFSQTHSLSFKAMREEILALIDNPWNHMEYISKNENSSKLKYNFEKYGNAKNPIKWITTEWIENEILSPTVKRSLIQTIKIINSLLKMSIKENWNIKNIAIEMPREKNNKTTQKQKSSLMKYNNEANKMIEKLLEDGNSKISKIKILKIKLWDEQNKKDAYTGKDIDLDELIKYSYNYEIDHIIPYSQIFDDSLNNKVLTSRQQNSNKGNRTPFQFLEREKFSQMKNEWAIWFLKNLKKSEKSKKYEYLIDEKDYSKPSSIKNFIGRNIVDTGYVAREFLAVLGRYINSKKNVSDDNETKVFANIKLKTITGKFTSFLRKKIKANHFNGENKILYPDLIDPMNLKIVEGDRMITLFEKLSGNFLNDSDREKTKFDINWKKNRAWNGHHAQDAALIVYATTKNYRIAKYIEESISFKKGGELNDKDNKDLEDSEIFGRELSQLADELNENWEKITFSKKIDFKDNVSLFNETLYSSKKIYNYKTKENEIFKIRKQDIYKLESENLNKFFDENSIDFVNPLIYSDDGDKKLWNELKKLAYENKEQKQPFKYLIDNQFKEKPNFVGDQNLILNYEINGKKQIKKIKYLRYLEKTPKNLFKMQKVDNGINSNVSFYESFNWLWLDIFRYKEKNEWNYFVVPINSIFLKISNNFKRNENKQENLLIPKIKNNKKFVYNSEKYLAYLKHKIKNNNFENVNLEFFMQINKNDLLFYKNSENNLENFWIIVGVESESNKIEIKPQFHNVQKQIQIQRALNSLKGWIFYKINNLGQLNFYKKID